MSRNARHLKDRLHQHNESAQPTCSVFGCKRPTENRNGRGLSPLYCRYHRAFKSRHGSAWCRSLSGKEVRPYITTAERFLKTKVDQLALTTSLDRIGRLYDGAGRIPEVGDLPILTPRQKALGVVARLREAGVKPIHVLGVVLGVLTAVQDQYVQPGGDYPRVNVAKALKRRASGHHVKYGPDARWDYYPESRGRFLVVLGRLAMEACDRAAREYVPDIIAAKIAKFGPTPIERKGAINPRSRNGDPHIRLPDPAAAPATFLGEEEMSADEMQQYADELRAAFLRRGAKAYDGKF
jgi:hypothetical protein